MVISACSRRSRTTMEAGQGVYEVTYRHRRESSRRRKILRVGVMNAIVRCVLRRGELDPLAGFSRRRVSQSQSDSLGRWRWPSRRRQRVQASHTALAPMPQTRDSIRSQKIARRHFQLRSQTSHPGMALAQLHRLTSHLDSRSGKLVPEPRLTGIPASALRLHSRIRPVTWSTPGSDSR